MSLDQFWAWMEFNRLSPFLEEREDLRAAQIASAVYNVNIIDKNALTKPSDFMLPPIDEMIKRELDRKEQEQHEAEMTPEDAQLAWKEQLKHMTRGLKPVETTVKVT